MISIQSLAECRPLFKSFSPLSKTVVAVAIIGLAGVSVLGQENSKLEVPADIQTVLSARCSECHKGDSAEADFDLNTLATMALAPRLRQLNRMQDQVFFQTMPPADAEPLSASEHQRLGQWLSTELRKHHASELDKKRRFPDYGNYVDHQALFEGELPDTLPSTPSRRWLVRPAIFHERVLDVFQLEDRERQSFRERGFYGVTNPFVLPDHSGVRDYDTGTLDGGHLLVMLGNAKWIAEKQLLAARIKKGELTPADLPNPKDRWYPKTTPPAFEALILGEDPPTDEELDAAIVTQFDLVLQRPPTTSELNEYRTLARDAIELGGPTAGLQQVLTAVLLESEFLYRYEFGGGEPDEAGRRLLAPREAAYAIAYALGDRKPDAKLLEAAESGKLTTREDFEREVVRLLDDPDYFRGPIDSSLNGNRQNMRSRIMSHPRLGVFFRDFFGYPAALKVFKDLKRSSGFYINPGRGSTQTPGHLVNEADRVLADIVEADKQVFETLLTTDRYYLYHPLENERGEKLVEGWRKAYEILKDTNWQDEPDKVVAEHDEMIRELLDARGITGRSKARHDNSLIRFMNHFEHTFGQGNKPFTTLPWAHGNHYWHSPIYSLPRTPGRDARYGNQDDFDYEAVQPFQVPHRKGILTHPAWLVAHSGNFQTDPIRRGRWIQEKLLAGRVPDIPITVDAQVPEDPHMTFRERVEKVTSSQECWKCHQHMNPLGFPFEAYDDFGRYRIEESLEHPDNLLERGPGNEADRYKTRTVETHGNLVGTEDPTLDGAVIDAFDLIDRLARSDRARQSIIRHAFRFFMGRNETLDDAQTLRDADRAYLENQGSFKAVVVSLLTSDSFRYRKDPTQP